MIRLAKKEDCGWLYKLDCNFYGDAFFSIDDYKRMIDGKSINIVMVDDDKTAFLIYCRMPKSKHLYITSLVGDRRHRRRLLEWFLSQPAKVHYTHGKMKWDMELLIEYGFKKGNKGDPAEEEIEFADDIKKLHKFTREM